jgi:hypothetical protein
MNNVRLEINTRILLLLDFISKIFIAVGISVEISQIYF